MTMYEDRIKQTYEQLKDFQKATVDYLVKRLYDENQCRMLVADEVGLGKTLIAKGVVAKAYERWCSESHEKKEHFNIYYICSNQQLSYQNLKKVNFTKDKGCIISRINRISMLAMNAASNDVPVHIYSLTPDTSFNPRSSQGIKDERMVIYFILEATGEFNNNHLSSLMKGSWSRVIWNDDMPGYRKWFNKEIIPEVRDSLYTEGLRNFIVNEKGLPRTYERYGLSGSMSLWNLLKTVVEVFDRRSNVSMTIYDEIIGSLRKVMTNVCLDLMKADIFIMDEFQRYSQLLNATGNNERDEIARKVFGQKTAKVLMLSATPFKAFTNIEGQTYKLAEDFNKTESKLELCLNSLFDKTLDSDEINLPGSSFYRFKESRTFLWATKKHLYCRLESDKSLFKLV